MARLLVACAVLATIVTSSTGRPRSLFSPSNEEETPLSAETRRQILQLGDEILREAQEYFELERLKNILENSAPPRVGWGPLETNDEARATVDQLTAIVIDGVLTAVKELDDSFLDGQALGDSSEPAVSDEENKYDGEETSVLSNNNVLYESSDNRLMDVENNLRTDDSQTPRFHFESDNNEDNRLVKRDTYRMPVEDRHRQIDAFLSELEKDIDKENKGKQDVSSYMGSQYSAPKFTTTNRPFWKKVGDVISTSYDKVKSKTQQVVTSVKSQF